MRYKSYRQQSLSIYTMSGNVSSLLNASLYRLDNMPYFNIAGGTIPGDFQQCRQTTAPFIDKVVCKFSARCTHNHAVALRFICFRNSGWQETLNFTYAVGGTELATLGNIFQDWLDKGDAGVDTANPQRFRNQVFNRTLCRERSHLMLDKTFYLRALQGVSTGGEVADTLSLKEYNFTIPIKRRQVFEDRGGPSAPELTDTKSGPLYMLVICVPADPGSASNSGDLQLQARISTVFRENI